MKIKDIINLIEGELLSGNYEDEITNIEQDSRNIKRGDTFIAFKGDDFDGNSFFYDAIQLFYVYCCEGLVTWLSRNGN